MKEEETELLNQLREIIIQIPVYLKINNVLSIPYKLCEAVENEEDALVPDEDECVKLYNMLTDETDIIPVSMITGFQWRHEKDGTVSVDAQMDDIQYDIKQVQQCVNDEQIDKPIHDIVAAYCGIDQVDAEWQVIKKFKLKYTINELRESNDSVMNDARNHYMKLIREHRNKSFEELDQLENDIKDQPSTNQDDLDDIEVIKQLFRDIPQETNLNNYKTIKDLYEFWPSLLLPKPKDLINLAELDALDPTQNITPQQEMRHILSGINDVNEIRMILPELGALNELPDGVMAEINERIRVLEQNRHVKFTN